MSLDTVIVVPNHDHIDKHVLNVSVTGDFVFLEIGTYEETFHTRTFTLANKDAVIGVKVDDLLDAIAAATVADAGF